MRRVLLALAALVAAGPALAAEAVPHAPRQSWSFNGLAGTYDRAALQRGFQVYQSVCAACHGLRLLSYRHLTGIGLSLDQVRAIARDVEVPSLSETGEPATRPALPSDRFRAPYANEIVARTANNGALPPDLSVMTKAREGGADYLFALLTGYRDPPAGVTMVEGMSYNQYFAGHQIAMRPPLVSDGQIEYRDGTRATIDQMARDVTHFLAWAAEPELEARKAMGWRVMIFLLVLSILLYAVKRKVWANLH